MLLCLDKLLADAGFLSDMDIQPGQSLQIELQSSDPVNHPLKLKPAPPPQAKLPALITVKTERSEFNNTKSVHVLYSVDAYQLHITAILKHKYRESKYILLYIICIKD